MCVVSVDIPEDVRTSTNMDATATTDFVCRTVAVAYFTRLHQPLVDCARIAGMSVDGFVQLLHASGIDADAVRLLSELQQGYRSGEEKGWHATEEVARIELRKADHVKKFVGR